MSQLSLEDICLSFCRDTALEILALRQQGGGFLPCLTTKILRIYSSRFNWYINIMSKGTVYNRKDGRWECRISMGRDENGRRNFRSFYGKNREEAEYKAMIAQDHCENEYAVTDQVAVRANSGGGIYKNDIDALREEVDKLWQPLSYFQSQLMSLHH